MRGGEPLLGNAGEDFERIALLQFEQMSCSEVNTNCEVYAMVLLNPAPDAVLTRGIPRLQLRMMHLGRAVSE